MSLPASLTPTKEAFENIKYAHLQACTWKHIPLMQTRQIWKTLVPVLIAPAVALAPVKY